jgi:hypothetical protein
VRLDHLLSKEHHPSKDGMEPAARGCRVGVLNGGDTGEFFPGNGRVPASTATSVVWNGVLVRLGEDVKHPVGS